MNFTTLKDIADRYIETLILPSDPNRPRWNRENFIFRKPPKWNYIDSCMISALIGMYDFCGDDRLLRYADSFMRAYVCEDGRIPSMRAEDYNLDNLCGGRVLMNLHRITGDERYRLAYERLWKEQVLAQPRLSCGSFFHKAMYPYQLWLDGVYMALPFMTEYGVMTNDADIIADVLVQLGNTSMLLDERSGLYRHGYDETRTMYWADRYTGLSPECWLRAMGWMFAGAADIAGLLPENTMCAVILRGLGRVFAKYQHEGLLYQLPEYGEALEGNYPETSGTLLLAYSALKASRLGIADDSIRRAGEEALYAVAERYIDTSGDVPVLRNICLMGGLGGEQHRDGSVQYYLSERIVENEAKGIAPFLMAVTELGRLGGQ